MVAVIVRESALSRMCGIEEAARICGIEIKVIREFCSEGLLRSYTASGSREDYYLDDEGLYLLGKVQRLRETHGVNLTGARIILELMHEMHRIEQEVKFLRDSAR